MSVSLTEEPEFFDCDQGFAEVFELDFHEPLCGSHGCACLDVSMFAAPLGSTRDLCSRTHDLCSRTHDLCSRTHDLCSRTHDLGSRTLIWVAGAGRMIWVAGRMIWVAGRMIWVVFVCPIKELPWNEAFCLG